MSAKLFVGNVSYDTTSQELHDLFAEVGAVESCIVLTDPNTGRSRGFAFVEMNSTEAADAAKEKFNGRDLQGRTLTVKEGAMMGSGNFESSRRSEPRAT